MRFAVDIHLRRAHHPAGGAAAGYSPREPVIWTVHGAYFPDADQTAVAEWRLAHAGERFGPLPLDASVRVERTPGIG